MSAPSRIERLRERQNEAILAYKERSRLVRVFRHRDYRLLWSGAFLSFIGSWIQNVAQGYLVFQMTGRNELLAWVSFFGMLPVTLFGPVAGTLTDTLNRRWLLVATQSIFAAGAFFLAAATYFHFVQYWHIVVVAVVLGTVSAVEMPTRQSIVSACVPTEDLPLAIPLTALTFNLSRLIGPAIGGVLLTVTGPDACYFINGVSFFALIFAGLAIRADLRATAKGPQPIRDLIAEGALYTFRDVRLRTLFVLESVVSMFGLFYLSQMPAIAAQMLVSPSDPHPQTHAKLINGFGYTAVGVGSVCAIAMITSLADRGVRSLLIRGAMTVMGFGLFALGFVQTEWAAYGLFAILGMCAIAHFNTTNTLFQTLSPARLRGRVLAMHIWALSGLGPFGVLAFGYLAQSFGLPLSLKVGGACVLIGAIWGWLNRSSLLGVDTPESFLGVTES